MSFTSFTQDLVVPTNVASTSIISAVRIPPSPSVMYGEKLEMFNEFTLRCDKKRYYYI